MIKIRRARQTDMIHVLKILDDFRTVVMRIIDPNSTSVADATKPKGAPVFMDVINSENGALFLALDNKEYIGIISIYKVPQIRKGLYRGEVEEMYVDPKYHGKGVGELLMKQAEKWARNNGIEVIQLISNFHLKRAHSFYGKMGFIETSKSFEKKL
jgi:GNAT superfamily N-acetyltransferase